MKAQAIYDRINVLVKEQGTDLTPGPVTSEAAHMAMQQWDIRMLRRYSELMKLWAELDAEAKQGRLPEQWALVDALKAFQRGIIDGVRATETWPEHWYVSILGLNIAKIQSWEDLDDRMTALKIAKRVRDHLRALWNIKETEAKVR